MPNLWVIFLTGLFAGGLTCMAVQGGLLATAIAQENPLDKKSTAVPIIFFLVSKFIAYALLGAGLGFLGSIFYLSLTAQLFLQLSVVIFMIGTALNLLQVHPIFRYFAVVPPRFLQRVVRKQSKSHSLFAPVALGFFTVFIPCGTTQAMMALAMGTGSPLFGAAILSAFVLGTSPLFFVLGLSMEKARGILGDHFNKATAGILIGLALLNGNGMLAVSGSPFTVTKLWHAFYCTVSICDDGDVLAAVAPVTKITVGIKPRGYTVDNSVIKAGAPITLTLVNTDANGCTQAFTIPRLGIRTVVRPGEREVIQFTAPEKPGELAFTCSMGMFGGSFQVSS